MSEQKRMITKTGTVAFPYVFKPNTYEGKTKYGLDLIMSEEDCKELKAAIKEFATENFPAATLKEKFKKGLFVSPIKDGNEKDTEKYPMYLDMNIVKMSSNYPAGLVDQDRQEILDESEFYAGCKARVQVGLFPWTYKNKIGVGLNPLNIQKMGDGEKMGGGRVDAADVFGDGVSTESDDDSDVNFDL